MNWNDLISREIESAYRTTDGLMALVTDDMLGWKPATGQNWMTTAQLLMHCTNASGACFKGFVTGDWGMPEGVDIADIPPEEMMPTAETMPAVTSVAEARSLLAEDKKIALDMLYSVTEHELDTRHVAAPWDPTEKVLGLNLLEMVRHLVNHKIQLFYYLKQQGVPVHTGHLYGM